MALQCDPTVIYALAARRALDSGNLTREDLQFDSPYNTYRYRRPAARARSPRPARASLEAAVRRPTSPTSTSSAATTASHVFATTLAEHNRNVQQWQVQYFRDQRRARGR